MNPSLRCCGSPFVAVVILIFAVSFKLFLFPFLKRQIFWPLDERMGELPILSEEELRQAYAGKRVVVVGGTRGIGLGIALAVASAGADVTVAGRSAKSGEKALERLRQVASTSSESKFSFVQGDIGSIEKANELVDRLDDQVQSQKEPRGFDYLVVTAAVFPNWERPQQQEDGIDLCFAVAVVGRYLVYKNMARFMKSNDASSKSSPVRVLNVLASGQMALFTLDHELASGDRNASSLFDSMKNFAGGSELMLKLIDSDPELHLYATRVSTHPGVLKTDLHRGQALWFDAIEFIFVSLIGLSIEDCGVRQASILASPKLPQGQLSYVSSDMVGRLTPPKLEAFADSELPWLRDFFQRLED